MFVNPFGICTAAMSRDGAVCHAPYTSAPRTAPDAVRNVSLARIGTTNKCWRQASECDPFQYIAGTRQANFGLALPEVL